MRFRTGGIAGLALLAAVLAMPVASAQKQDAAQVEPVKAPAQAQAAIRAPDVVYGFVLSAKNLRPSDTVRLVGNTLQLRSHGATNAQVLVATNVTARDVEHWRSSVSQPSPTAIPFRSDSATAGTARAHRMRQPAQADSASDSTARTRTTRTATRVPARLQT